MARTPSSGRSSKRFALCAQKQEALRRRHSAFVKAAASAFASETDRSTGL